MARTLDIAGILGTWARGDRPLYEQLADALRGAIDRRDLPPGARLPAERELARMLVVSRTTVSGAYEALKGEGYLESRQGSGTRVCAVSDDVRRRGRDGQVAARASRRSGGAAPSPRSST